MCTLIMMQKNKHATMKELSSAHSFQMQNNAQIMIPDEGVTDLQRILESVIKFTQSSLIATAVAIVWSTEYCHYILLMRPIVALTKQNIRIHSHITLRRIINIHS